MHFLFNLFSKTLLIHICLNIFSEAKFFDECGSWKYVDHVNLAVDMLVTGGHDIYGHLLLVCRSQRSPKIILPGKARPELGRCYTSYGGGESFTDKFEVLSEDVAKSFQWVPYNGIIPENAVLGGREHIAPMYIGKCILKGKFKNGKDYKTELVGKIHYSPADPKFVYVPFAGLEFKCREDLKILVCTDPEQINDSMEEWGALIDARSIKSKNSTTIKKTK